MKKIISTREKLIEAMKVGSNFANKNATIPITECVRIESELSKLKISSTNIGCSSSFETECDPSSDNASFCVNAALFSKAVNSCPSGNVSLEYEKDDNRERMAISYRNGKITLPTYDSNEFPETKSVEDRFSFALPAETLRYILNICHNFIGHDEMRPTMTGICLTVSDNRIEYSATDAHILIHEVFEISNDYQGEEMNVTFIIPESAIKAILSICPFDDRAAFTTDERRTVVKCGTSSVVFSNVEGRFPNVIPIIDGARQNGSYVLTDSAQLLMSLKRTLIAANNETFLARIGIRNDHIEITAEDLCFSRHATENIPAANSGDDIEIGMSIRNLEKVLPVFSESDSVRICYSSPHKAVFFKDENRDGRTVIVMPMKL